MPHEKDKGAKRRRRICGKMKIAVYILSSQYQFLAHWRYRTQKHIHI